MLIGSATNPGKSEGGIYVYEFDSQSGKATYITKAIVSTNFLTVSSDRKFVYSVGDSNRVTYVNAFAFNSKTGELKFLNKQPLGNVYGTYISIDAADKYVFTANYSGGSVSAIPIEKNGSLAPDIQFLQYTGQTKPRTHSAVVSPDNRYVISAELGTDIMNIYRFNPAKRPDALIHTASVALVSGAGPRHSTFHPNKKFFYVVTELNSTIAAFSYKDGQLTAIQAVSMIPEGFTGRGAGADVHVSADGKFLYATNRNDLKEILIYSIDKKTGKLAFVAKHPTLGDNARSFDFDPTGNFLVVTNWATGTVIIFTRDQKTGLITPTGQKLDIGRPGIVKFVKMD